MDVTRTARRRWPLVLARAAEDSAATSSCSSTWAATRSRTATSQGLASPLCDAIMLAAGARCSRSGRPVLGGVFGIGCDGELTPAEVLERLPRRPRAGGLAGDPGLTAPVVERLDQAVSAVPTEASAQALRCFRGEVGHTTDSGRAAHRGALPVGAATVYFDPAVGRRLGRPLAARCSLPRTRGRERAR